MIFVAGTAYSGSTYLDMVLSNDEAGFSCGELNALAVPYRPHHFTVSCGCGDADCTQWSGVPRTAKGIHQRIFDSLPNARFLVDSSKSIPWIRDRTRELLASGIHVRHILIWKTPLEYYRSRQKRGLEAGWARAWADYHRLYLAEVEPHAVVNLDELSDPDSREQTLEQICASLSIAYQPGKFEYWNKTHHTLFGNSSAKISLHQPGSSSFSRMEKETSALAANRALLDQKAVDGTDLSSLPDCSEAQSRVMNQIVEWFESSNTPSHGASVAFGGFAARGRLLLQRLRILQSSLRAKWKHAGFRPW